MAKNLTALKRQSAQNGPQTDEELHAWIKKNLGFDIPRVAVCDDHQAPFDFVADIYFERVTSAVAMANRGGSKTMSSAIIQLLNALFKPGCEGLTVGAIEAQSKRAYENLKTLLVKHGKILTDGKVNIPSEHPKVVRTIESETLFDNGSKYEIVPGCLPSHATVVTPDGNKRIGEIVSKKLVGPVKTFNFETQNFEWQEVVGWHKNGVSKEWLKFKLDVSTLQGPSDLYCTPGHKLLTVDGEKIHAAKFSEGDSLCVTTKIMSDKQEQVLMGMLLGDGHISKNYRYRVCHTPRQMNYLEWFADAFSEFNPYWYRRVSKNTFDVDLIRSRRFSELRNEWYPHGIKRVPDSVWNNLDELGIACWLMDDGSWVQQKKYGGSWIINCLFMNKEERKAMKKYFDGLGIEGSWSCVNKEKDQWIWRTINKSGILLQAMVSDYIDISEKQEVGYKKWVADKIDTHSHDGITKAIIKSIEKSDVRHERYDITVPPHANYVISSGLVISNTPAAVNGPHNPKVHTDEVELMDGQVFEESRNISQSKTIIETDPITGEERERIIKAQDWITSTRKRASGPMQKILDSIYDAKKRGNKPPYELYVWCYAETAKNVPNCREAFPDLPEDQKCNCNKIVNGFWDDGEPRRFNDVCKGKLAKSSGYIELDNIHKRFMESDQGTWEAQQECSKPELGGMVFKTWSNDTYGIKWYTPQPELGPIVQGIDFGGGTTPAAVNWYQILNQPVYVWGKNQARSEAPMKLLETGTVVCFDEIYIAETGNIEVAEQIKIKENRYKEIFNRKNIRWDVKWRFADPANKAARADFRRMGLNTTFMCTRDIVEQIKTCNAILKKNLFAVDLEKCEMFPQEALAYHYPYKKIGLEYDPEKPVDDFNHTMSNFRYTMQNLKTLEKRGVTIAGKLPKTDGNIYGTISKSPIKSSAPRYLPR